MKRKGCLKMKPWIKRGMQLAGAAIVSKRAWDGVKPYTMAEIQIDINSRLYFAVLNWFDTQKPWLSISEKLKAIGAQIDIHSPDQSERETAHQDIQLTFLPNAAMFWNDGIPIWLGTFTTMTKHQSDYDNQSAYLSIKTLLPFRKKLRDLISDICQKSLLENFNPKIRAIEQWNTTEVGHPTTVPLMLDLAPNSVSEIVSDFERFLLQKEWYKTRGKRYKRTYLLYGPPGTGKSLLIQQIARKFGFDVDYIYSNFFRSGDAVSILRQTAGHKSIVLIEDIHCLGMSKDENEGFKSVETSQSKNPNRFAEILNFLDGPLTQDDMIIFMTANDITELPEVFLRESRVDVLIEVPELTCEKVEANFRHFYQYEGEMKAQSSHPMSRVQSAFNRYPDDPAKAAELLKIQLAAGSTV